VSGGSRLWGVTDERAVEVWHWSVAPGDPGGVESDRDDEGPGCGEGRIKQG
jgi:hypothetical protein